MTKASGILREGDLVQPTVRGVVVLTPVEIRPRVIEAGRKVTAKNRSVIDRLAKDDRGAGTGRR